MRRIVKVGLDTDEKARRASFLMLRAFEEGDERKSSFVFPNLVFKLKAGINLEKSSANYDLYKKSLSVTAKKMIPTYFNCDSISNKEFLAENIGIMGCRTRVASNINGQLGAFNRGNVASVTLNLVQLAYLAERNIKKFYKLLEENLEDAKQAMKEEAARVPKTGKTADIIRAQCQCYFNFFDRVIGEGAHEEMFQGKISLNACLDAADELLKFENDEATKLNGRYSEYTIQQHGNRQQRRNYNKQHGKKQNKGNVTYYRNGNR